MKSLGHLFLLFFFISLALCLGLLWALDGQWIPFHSLMVGVSLVALLLALLINGRTYYANLRSDKSQFIGSSLGTLAFVGFFAGAANFLGRDPSLGWDFSPGRRLSLHQSTHQILDPLVNDIAFHLFYTDNPEGLAAKRQIRQAFQAIIDQKPQIDFKEISIFDHPEKVKKFNVGDSTYALFVTYKENVHRMQGSLSEKDIVSAALKVSQAERVVYIWKNSGRRQVEESGPYGLSLFKANLEKLYYKVRVLDHFPVPQDGALLAVLGERSSWPENDLETLKSYLNAGGRVLLAVDPESGADFSSFLTPLGLRVPNHYIKKADATQSPYVVFTRASPEHPELSKVLSQDNPYFYLAAPIEANVAKDSQKYRQVTPLLHYEPQTQILADLEESDHSLGSVDEASQFAAVLVEKPVSTLGSLSPSGSSEKDVGSKNHSLLGQLILVGDSDVFTNQWVTHQANFSLAVGLMNFLSQDPQLTSIVPQRVPTNYLLMSQTQLNFYFLFLILPVPLIFFLLALVLRVRRAL